MFVSQFKLKLSPEVGHAAEAPCCFQHAYMR